MAYLSGTEIHILEDLSLWRSRAPDSHERLVFSSLVQKGLIRSKESRTHVEDLTNPGVYEITIRGSSELEQLIKASR